MTAKGKKIHKLKPSWMLTDIPKTIKFKLWRLMKDNPTYDAWEQAIVGSSSTTEQDQLFSSDEYHYIKTSKDTYKSLKEELLLMPPTEIKSLPEDLRNWVSQIRPELQVAPQFAPQPEIEPIVSYEETPHKQMVRKVARELADTIRLPSTGYSFIPGLSPGQSLVLKGGLTATVNQEGEIGVVVNIPDELQDHLSSSRFLDVLAEIRQWQQGAAEYLLKCHEFITFLQRHLEKEFSIYIKVPEPGHPGPTQEFLMFICADAIERACGSYHFKDFPYRYDDLGLRFGAYLIYRVGINNISLELVEQLHAQMRAKCTQWKRAKDIAAHIGELDQIRGDIVQKLERFANTEYLPGLCELCTSEGR